MALISKDTISKVNSMMDAVSIVGDYVRLEKKGGRWWGKCPFHGGGQEKTASFKVEPDSKLYHCFGCKKGGSVISFVMEMDNLSYPEAVKNIAQKTGIEIVYEEGSGEDESNTSVKEELYELYRRVTGTFQHFLKEKEEGKAAVDYLSQRGISQEMIDEFKLGYAPFDRDFLYNFLRKKSYSEEFLGKSGLFLANYKTLPLFSGRLMFPITDRQGKIVAFSGRALPGTPQIGGREPPKYINSPETEIYKKGQTLFAIDNAKPAMRSTKTACLAEGNLDVIALHQAGVTNTVAPLGTAFTEEQASWLRRWVDNVILIFDNDEAGQKAAYKGIVTCKKNGINCSLAALNEGLKNETGADNYMDFKDPAEILQKFGSEILKNVLKFTINDFEYLIGRGKLLFAAKGDIKGAAEHMYPFVDALDSEIERDDSITRIADIFKIERSAVQKDYSQWKAGLHPRKEQEAPIAKLKVRRNAELSLLAIVAVNLELYQDFRAAVEIKEIDDPAAKEIFIALEECFKHDESGIDSLLARIKDESLRDFVADCGTSGEFKGSSAQGPRRLMEDGIKKIRIKRLEKRIIQINAQIRESERNPDAGGIPGGQGIIINIDELLEEKKIIDSQIRDLEGR
ncbi:MAG: DNA primase [Treponema sp.]|nr:DNA primase [Treponema sp.]